MRFIMAEWLCRSFWQIRFMAMANSRLQSTWRQSQFLVVLCQILAPPPNMLVIVMYLLLPSRAHAEIIIFIIRMYGINIKTKKNSRIFLILYYAMYIFANYKHEKFIAFPSFFPTFCILCFNLWTTFFIYLATCNCFISFRYSAWWSTLLLFQFLTHSWVELCMYGHLKVYLGTGPQRETCHAYAQ